MINRKLLINKQIVVIVTVIVCHVSVIMVSCVVKGMFWIGSVCHPENARYVITSW